MNTIDDLIDWVYKLYEWEMEHGGCTQRAIEAAGAYYRVFEKVKELKTNMEKNCV